MPRGREEQRVHLLYFLRPFFRCAFHPLPRFFRLCVPNMLLQGELKATANVRYPHAFANVLVRRWTSDYYDSLAKDASREPRGCVYRQIGPRVRNGSVNERGPQINHVRGGAFILSAANRISNRRDRYRLHITVCEGTPGIPPSSPRRGVQGIGVASNVHAECRVRGATPLSRR